MQSNAPASPTNPLPWPITSLSMAAVDWALSPTDSQHVCREQVTLLADVLLFCLLPNASPAARVMPGATVATGPHEAVLPPVHLHEAPTHSRLCVGWTNRPTKGDIHSAFVRRSIPR